MNPITSVSLSGIYLNKNTFTSNIVEIDQVADSLHFSGAEQKDLQSDFMDAVKNGDLSRVLDFISKSNIDINHIPTPEHRILSGIPAIMEAVANNHLDILKALINAGADVNIKNKHKVDALVYAAELGFTEHVELLINSGANVFAKTLAGDSALQRAKENGHKACADLIVAAQKKHNHKV